MAAQNLGKRLIRDIKREGKKTAVLGLLLLGGLGIWLPQLWNRITASEAVPTNSRDRGNPSLPISSHTQAAPAPQPASPESDWNSLRSRLENASLVQPVTFDELVRDPFDRNWFRQKTASKKTQPDQGPPPTADPIQTLVCSATLVGPNFRAAIIGDAVYRVGQKVPSKGPIQYVLKEVLPDRVLLEREGRVESLRIHQRSVDDDQEGQ